VVATIGITVGGLGYSFGWMALSHRGWVSVSDLWNSAGIALALAHGHWSAVYGPSSQVISPPGLEVLMSPFVALGHAAGLRSPAHGSSATLWLVVAPVAILIASTCLFALDAVARSWNISERRRTALALVASIGVVSAVMFWGHPEDCLALAFVLWAALAVERRGGAGLTRAGWLLGCGVACQPLALLAVAPVVARFGWRAVGRIIVPVLLPSLALVLPALSAAPHRAIRALVEQPYFPPAESFTPFSPLAPSLGHGLHSGGPMRLLATLAAVALGWAVCRRRHDLAVVLLTMSLAFGIRVLFETELLGFYFLPVIALCLLLASRQGWPAFGFCATAAIVCTVLGNRREHTIGLWWPAMMVATFCMLAVVAWPILSRRLPASPQGRNTTLIA